MAGNGGHKHREIRLKRKRERGHAASLGKLIPER